MTPDLRLPAETRDASASAGARASWLVVAAAVAFVVLAPNVGVHYTDAQSYDVRRWLQIGVLFAAAAAYLCVPSFGAAVHGRLGRGPARLSTAVLGLGAISALLSVRPLYGLREVALLGLLFLLAISFAAAAGFLGTRLDRVFAGAIAVSALFYVTLFLSVQLFSPWGRAEWSYNPFVGYPTPRFFGYLQTWTLPIVVLPLLDREPATRLQRAAYWTAAAGWWMLLPVSGSRGPVLALVVGFAAALLVFGGRAVPWLKVHAIALLAGGAAYHLVPGVARSSLLGSALERGGANNGRFSFWARAAQLIEDAPWLGVGPGNFAHYRLPGIYSPAHPHNTLLQVAAEWGLPAAALASALVLWGLYVWARARRAGGADDGSPQVAVAITASLAAGVAHSFIDGIAVMPLSQTFGALVVGWALSVHARGSPAPAQRRETAGVRWGCRALAVLALVTLASTLRLPLRPLAHNEAPAPRFWLRGAVP